MTELELRTYFVDTVRSYYGTVEGDARHRELIDWYNRLADMPCGLPRGYRMTYSADWCVATAVAVAVQTGLTDIIHPECSCTRAIEMYEAEGRFTSNKNYVPQPGDFLVFDWKPGTGPDHWATVVRVEGNLIRTIEGNMLVLMLLPVTDNMTPPYTKPAIEKSAMMNPLALLSGSYVEKTAHKIRTAGAKNKSIATIAPMSSPR